MYPIRSVLYPTSKTTPALRRSDSQSTNASGRGGSPPMSPTQSNGGITSLDHYLEDPPSHPKREDTEAERREASGENGVGGSGAPASSLAGEAAEESAASDFVMTTRFEHTVNEDGSNYVLTGRGGQLDNCEDEVRCLALLRRAFAECRGQNGGKS